MSLWEPLMLRSIFPIKISLQGCAMNASNCLVHFIDRQAFASHRRTKSRFCFQNRQPRYQQRKVRTFSQPAFRVCTIGILTKGGHQKACISIPNHERRKTRTGFSGSSSCAGRSRFKSQDKPEMSSWVSAGDFLTTLPVEAFDLRGDVETDFTELSYIE